MTNTQKFAEKELDILVKSSPDPENRPIIEPFIPEILSLCEKFGSSGQSGGSAPYTATALAQAIKKLCLQEPICPITGIEDEWMDVTEMNDGKQFYQNKRCGAIFKDGIDGRPYYLDAIVWKESEGGCYTGRASLPTGEVYRSRQHIKKYPFTPKKFYIDVIKEILPQEWTEEPFIEWNYYDTKHFEQTGEKIWQVEKYRNIIKDPKQLKKAFKYYDLFQ